MSSRMDKDEVMESAEALNTKQPKSGSSAKFHADEDQSMASRMDKDEVMESTEELNTKQQKAGSSAKFDADESEWQELLMKTFARLVNHFDSHHMEEKKEIESLKTLLEKQSKEKEKRIENRQKEAVAEFNTHKREMQSLKSENERLTNDLERCKNDARTEVNKMMKEKVEEIQKLQNDIKIGKVRTASVEERLIEMLTSATAEKNDLKSIKTKLEEKVKETEQLTKLLQFEINGLQKQIAETQTQCDELIREKLENEQLAELDPTKKEIQRLKNLLEKNHDIRKLNQVDMQSNLSGNSTYLRINNRTITYVAPGTFDNLSSLTKLDLNYSGLIFLENGVFNNLTNLIDLNLSDNYLTCLEENVFAGLKKLKNIFFSNNNIAKFPPQLFRGLDSLEQIHFSDNKISEFDEDLLVGLNRLTSFTAYNNHLTSIPEKLFGDCVQLEKVQLQNNTIVRLKTTIFDSLHNLKSLYLHNNWLNEMDKNALKMLTIVDFKI